MAIGIAWATIQDIEDLIGAVEDAERATRLLERATGIVASYICWPLVEIDPIDDVPAPVREAVATMASRALTGTAGSAALAAETIGGYSYRLAQPASATDAMRITPDLEALLRGYRCGGGSASVVVCNGCGALEGRTACQCGEGASSGFLGGSAGQLGRPVPLASAGEHFLAPGIGRWFRESLPRGPSGRIPLR